MLVKEIISVEEAVSKINKGDSVMVGGFIGCGTPDSLLGGLKEVGTDDLTLICNDSGILDPENPTGLPALIVNKQFSKMLVSHIGTNPETGRQMNAGETDVQLIPQGTLVERIRSAGIGLGGFLTPTGLGTEVEEGKQVIDIDGIKYLLELPLRANVALIKAKVADKSGNLLYSKTARNFNPVMAMSADLVIVEAEELVEIGDIDPEHVVTPSIFVDYIVMSK
ncbi:MAG: branched-chain amino acid dehydrogenase [Denitrovibrio sp.]|nr:MAG: branched-chain amino acid dehydrogenase [Denitrovibrio sp.]